MRLKPMKEWNPDTFEQHLGRKVAYGLIMGHKFSPKAEIANSVVGLTNGKLMDMEAIRE
jgi:hypothetical protein